MRETAFAFRSLMTCRGEDSVATLKHLADRIHANGECGEVRTMYGGALLVTDKSGHGLRETLSDFETALRQFATTDLVGLAQVHDGKGQPAHPSSPDLISARSELSPSCVSTAVSSSPSSGQ